MKRLLFLFTVCTSVVAAAQQNVTQGFVLDHSKPYVFLQFDHIGPRTPVQSGESDLGLWIKVRNNCRIPIVFLASGNSRNAGVRLMDEVVEDEPLLLQVFSSTEDEDKATAREKTRMQHLKQKPEGYSCEVCGTIRVDPGKQILFSVPRNHVSEDWHLQVKFALDVSDTSIATGPFTYLRFFEHDIPKEQSQNSTIRH